MLNVTTKYDKIGDVRKRVFVIRGDEAYARTVDLDLSYTRGTGVDANNIRGFLVTLDATLYRNLGDSKIVFYDGEEIIDSVTTHGYDQTYSLNARLSWGVDHKIYAHYKSNKQTLGKKSKSFTLHEAIPPEYVPTITFTSPTQITEGSSYTATGTATFLNEPLIGIDIDIYVDNVFKTTVVTDSNGAFSYTVTGLSKSKHTVTAEILQSEQMNAQKKTINISVGYIVSIIEYSKTMLSTVDYPLKVSVKSHTGSPVANQTVTFNGTNSSTNAQGIATFTLRNLDSGSYRASCNGTYSDYISVEKIPSPTIQVTSNTRVIAYPYSLEIPISMNGGAGLKIDVFENNVAKGQVTLDSKGTGKYFYKATGNGKVNVKFSGAGAIKVIQVIDCIAQVSPVGVGDPNYCLTFPSVKGGGSIADRHINIGLMNQGAVTFAPKSNPVDGNVLEMAVSSCTSNHDIFLYYGNKLMMEITDLSQGNYKFKYVNGTFTIYKNNVIVLMKNVEQPTGSNKNWEIANNSFSFSLVLKELYIYNEA